MTWLWIWLGIWLVVLPPIGLFVGAFINYGDPS
jgi:hypothetical protein